MGLFPQFNGKALPDLIALFRADPSENGVEPCESDLFFQEIAVAIAKCGSDGAAFLLDALTDAEPERAEAILLAFAFVEKESVKHLLAQIKSVVFRSLSSPDPNLVAQAADTLGLLGYADVKDAIAPLLNDDSPFVVGSALRFFSRHYPSEAKAMLLKALTSSEPIIRQNAIDELDELECTEALPSIAGLLNDPDKDVQEAAQWAVEHLEEAKGKPKPHRAKAS